MKPRKNATARTERRTVAYVRVSTQDQANEGVSLASQQARIGAYCTAMGWDVSEVVCGAAESASNLQRPGMAKILATVRDRSVERVVVAKLDRLTRSVRDLVTLVELTRSVRDLVTLVDLFAKHDAALVSVGETLDTSCAAGRMVVNMLGVVAQWEREAIAERTSSALAHKRQHRTTYGPTPFGYVRVGDALLPEPREQAVLKDAVRMDRDGASFRALAST